MAELEWANRLALGAALAAVALRCLPFLAYLCLRARTHAALRCSVIVTALATCGIVGVDSDALWVTGVMAYYAVAGVGVFFAERAYRAGALSAGAVFAASAGAFLAMPALVLPRTGAITVLGIGWQLLFAAYSYCLEAGKEKARPSLGDCVFFLMVNPVLVFPQRGSVVGTRLSLRGVPRFLAGALGLFVGISALVPLVSGLSQLAFEPPGWLGFAYGVVGLGILRFACAYAVQAGDVNLRIGLVRCLGHEVPDSFNYPFLATGPLDFWLRWNRYLLIWLKRYVYAPLARVESLRHLGTLGLAIALVVTFLSSGLLHEIHAYASQARWVGRFLSQFALIGACTLLWLVVDRALKEWTRRARSELRAALRVVRAFTARATVVAGMLACPMVWG